MRLLCVISIIITVAFVSLTSANSRFCETTISKSWLDLAIVVEASTKTLVPSTIFDIITRLQNYVYRLSIDNCTNVSHTTRITLISYDSTSIKVHFSFEDAQNFDSALTVLSRLQLLSTNSLFGNLLSALQHAETLLDNNKSFRKPGILLVAAGIDEKQYESVLTESTAIKEGGIKIATVAYTNDTSQISALSSLASQGLDITKDELDVLQFGKKTSLLNCVCPEGTTVVTLRNFSVIKLTSECALITPTSVLPLFTECKFNGLLMSMETVERFDFLINLLLTTQNSIRNISIGLSRNTSTSPWMWQTLYGTVPYNGYPPWINTPLKIASYGFLRFDKNSWKLDADSGEDNSRPYVCVSKSCDTDNLQCVDV